jgi:Fe-S-cluster containining protein
MMNNGKHAPTDLTSCQRCGTCCQKGGPGLHLEDYPLVDSGKIPLENLLTLRMGEPAYDNVTGTISPAITDIIKIKSNHDNISDCAFYNGPQKSCRIYDRRPIECEVLECWDTRRIVDIYKCRRLTRRHLLSKVKSLWELVEDHQQRCDYSHIAKLVTQIRDKCKAQEATEDLLELIRYDKHLRDVTLERTNLEFGTLSFLFGRPLSFTIKFFRIQMTKAEQRITFRPIGPSGDQICYRRDGF